MQFKSKLKAVAAALAIVAAGAASASVSDGSPTSATPGSGEIWFAVYDPVAAVSFEFDTGVLMSAFNGNSNYSYSLAAPGADWANFVAASNTANWKWMVGSEANNGLTTATKVFTTWTGTDLTAAITNTSVKNMASNGAGFTNTNNSFGTQPGAYTVNGSDKVSSSDGPAYFGNAAMTGTWGTQFTGRDASTTLGSTLNFFSLALSSTSTTAKATAVTFAGKWNLDGAGNLTYMTSAVPTPEADTWAMFASGLLVVGAIARRRLGG